MPSSRYFVFDYVLGVCFIFDDLLFLSGCPRKLQVSKVVCDPLLVVDIDEMRRTSKETARTDMIEDFTAVDEEQSE